MALFTLTINNNAPELPPIYGKSTTAVNTALTPTMGKRKD